MVFELGLDLTEQDIGELNVGNKETNFQTEQEKLVLDFNKTRNSNYKNYHKIITKKMNFLFYFFLIFVIVQYLVIVLLIFSNGLGWWGINVSDPVLVSFSTATFVETIFVVRIIVESVFSNSHEKNILDAVGTDVVENS